MERAELLKNQANSEFSAQNFRGAIELYTEAFNATTSSTPLELKRTVLSNRTQTYTQYGNIHNAINDIHLALSSQYTNAQSPKDLTAKCYYRRAKLLCKFAKYEEARDDFEQFEKIRQEIGREADFDQLQLKEEIAIGLEAPKGGRRHNKDDLMRAIDSRGILLREKDRADFPYNGNGGRESKVRFNTADGQVDQSLPDPNLTPIALPIFIVAPHFQINPEEGNKPYRTINADGPVDENATVGSMIENLFTSVAAFAVGDVPEATRKNIMMSAVIHDHPDDSTVLFITFGGRILKVPRSTTIAQLVAGVKWPRTSPVPFEDLRTKPRARAFETDGVELSDGWYTQLYVIPNDEVAGQIEKLERGLAYLNM